MEKKRGRVTIPTDLNVIPQTLEILEKWGADAVRDCDGTEFPAELKEVDAKVYATYYTTRKDNEWAKAHPEEIQQMYIMTDFYSAVSDKLSIHLMDHIYPAMLKVNTRDDKKRWWEVMDRTTGEPVPTDKWSYDEESGNVIIDAVPFHDYTVSFLAYIMWDPVHMYNAVVNDWKDVEPQMTFDVRQPLTREFSLKRLRRFLETHPYVDVVRFTTFFHQFTLIFDEEKRGKIMWLQSLDEPQFAMPVVDPAGICADYNPTVNDELLTPLGQFSEESLFVLVTIRVPSDITRMTINLKGPIIINTDNLRGEQIIVEDEVQTRFPIYDILKSRKEKAGE